MENNEFQELERIERAFYELLDILSKPKIKRSDFRNNCEYSLIYLLIYPLAITPYELGDCFRGCQLKADLVTVANNEIPLK